MDRGAEDEVGVGFEQVGEVLIPRLEEAVVLEDSIDVVSAIEHREGDGVGDEHIVAGTTEDQVVGSTADQPVVDCVADELVGEGRAFDALDINPELAEGNGLGEVEILVDEVGGT